jgi:hypothetical protein
LTEARRHERSWNRSFAVPSAMAIGVKRTHRSPSDSSRIPILPDESLVQAPLMPAHRTNGGYVIALSTQRYLPARRMNETRRARRHAELPSEVLDIETAFGVEGNGAAPLMEPETRLHFRTPVRRRSPHPTPLTCRSQALEERARIIGHDPFVIPLPRGCRTA